MSPNQSALAKNKFAASISPLLLASYRLSKPPTAFWRGAWGKAIQAFETTQTLQIRIDEEREDAISRGFLQPIDKSYSLTKSGEEVVRSYFGGGQLPPKRKNWAEFERHDLVRLALGIESDLPSTRRIELAKLPGLAREILRQAHKLDLAPVPTLREIYDRLGFTLLTSSAPIQLRTFFRSQQFSHKSVFDALCIAYIEERDIAKADRAAQICKRDHGSIRALAATHLAADDDTAEALRVALFMRWLIGPPLFMSEGHDTTTKPASSDVKPLSLKDFADLVKQNAPKAPTGWWEDDAIFIHHAWTHIRPLDSLEHFKEQLLNAHHQGLLKLRRAEVPRALNPDDFRASRLHDPQSENTYVFIIIDRALS